MPSSTVENYLKQIYLEQQRTDTLLVQMGQLAEAMQVTPGTATSMIKALSDSGLVGYEPRVGVKLTREGEQLALHVLRRHRIIELYLVQSLGLDWSEVHEEADSLEHAISDKVLEKIDESLGFPEFDPHGDPIPTASGTMSSRKLSTLTDCPLGEVVRIARVIDQDVEFLRFMDKHHLKPGAKVTVENKDTIADAVTLKSDGKPALTLGSKAASKILVESL
ncbi:MAG: metal-dependent transcriptional regulator [Planctomycetota bacterium]|jgi:DtxR family Mn-dependent transcriptional regulator|nr:metal-dependent transcriptional regulator [Planctomycetota bacterium]MDP7249083.1 metal-dependent transcriptional regulator [Planctomycetota bacterium]